ncbi:MAG TPA: glycoside hydrolase family 3 protein [Pseudonocardiaceae bacterium]
MSPLQTRGGRWLTGLLAAVALGASTLALTPDLTSASASNDVPPAASQPELPFRLGGPGNEAAHGWLTNTIQRMTLEEKVGQLFVTYVYGAAADITAETDPQSVAANRAAHGVDNAAQLIEKYHLGGVVYFAWAGNTQNPRQIAELSNGLQRAAVGQRVPIPVLVSIDQEYGVVYRVGPPATQFPGNMALGAARDRQAAQEAARIGGTELRAMGIHQNYAPVGDVNVNPANPVIGARSYGEDPELVAELIAAQSIGYEQARVVATAKHFPGHGDTTVDSHTGMPVIQHSREELEQVDLLPFRAAVDSGIDAIMTGHLVVPALDPSGTPATLSWPVITGLLRKELGFDGVVITDSLGMAGVRQKYGDDRIPVLALKAGADLLLKPPSIEVAYHAVLDAVHRGELTEERIDESVYRVLWLKLKLGLFDEPFVDPEALPDLVGAPEHLATAQEISDRTVTLVRNEGELLPLTREPRNVLVTGWSAPETPAPQYVAEELEARGATVTVHPTGLAPSQQLIDEAVARAGGADLVVAVTSKAWADSGQQRLVRALQATGKPVVVVAVRDPYDIAHFPDVPVYLATYSFQRVSLDAAVRVLFGEVAPTGRLPVTVPVAGQPDAVLYPYGHGLGYSH